MNIVPSHSLQMALDHVLHGGTLYVPTYGHCTVINKKCLEKWMKAGLWLLKEEGEGYRLKTGKSSVYLFPGQLKYSEAREA